MSDDEKDLFGGSSSDGNDTDDLLATANKKQKPIATKKSRIQKNSKVDDDDDDDDEVTGLFDSDDEETTTTPKKKRAKPERTQTLSKRERLAALAKQKREASRTQHESSIAPSGVGEERKKRKKERKPDGASLTGGEKEDAGYDSGDSYNSGAEYVRTKEDDDFIDVEGEDEDAIREYYAEQHFDDERGDEAEEVEDRPRKGAGGASKKRGPDALSEADKRDADNPIMQAVMKMKKKKKQVKGFEELRETASEFVRQMERAASEDELSIAEKRPGLKKLQMLPEVLEMMANKDMTRPLLEENLLIAIKRWIQPGTDGSLGNVTVRFKLLEAVSKMNGESGIDKDDLKKSDFGKLVMLLCQHKMETLEIKKVLKKLIEQWSRLIFDKSGNMRHLEQAHARRRDAGLASYARSQAPVEASTSHASSASRTNDLGDVLSKGVKQARDLGKNRVRIPYSKGFQYTIRPEDLKGDVTDKKTRISTVKETRGSLHKRMLEKTRPVSKNARSANISIEGRPTK
jgi:transcription factor SPN1